MFVRSMLRVLPCSSEQVWCGSTEPCALLLLRCSVRHLLACWLVEGQPGAPIKHVHQLSGIAVNK